MGIYDDSETCVALPIALFHHHHTVQLEVHDDNPNTPSKFPYGMVTLPTTSAVMQLMSLTSHDHAFL
jgi:hypothetical protein